MATKKIPVGTGLNTHINTSAGAIILVAIASLIMLWVFNFMSQQNMDDRSQAAKGGCILVTSMRAVKDKYGKIIKWERVHKCAKDTNPVKSSTSRPKGSL